MDDLEIRRLQMLMRVCKFGATHADAFPPSNYGGELFDQIGKVTDQLNKHAEAQVSGKSASMKGTTAKAVLRNELREDLVAIRRTALSIALDKPGFDDDFRLPRGRNDQLLLNAARSFAKKAAQSPEDFTRHEIAADFLQDLENDIAMFEKAVGEQSEGTAAQVSASAAIDEVIERGMTAVVKLDAIVRNKFRNNLSALAEWTSASHTEKPPRAAAKNPPDQSGQ